MAAYRLTSHVCPIRPKGRRVTISAIATGERAEQLRVDMTTAAAGAEPLRAALVALLHERLLERGHEVLA